jgi:hypothetical protein
VHDKYNYSYDYTEFLRGCMTFIQYATPPFAEKSSPDIGPSAMAHARFRSYMEQRGYGWLHEVDDEEEEDQRPLLEELEIDLPAIALKLRWALKPPNEGVKDSSDFWGPMGVMLAYAALLVWGQLSVVSWILTLWVCGSALVFFLARVLGADVTLSHTFCALGYCVLPLVLSRCLMIVLGSTSTLSLALRALCTAWATYSAQQWLQTKDLARKRVLLLYPILLYFVFLTAVATGV